MQTNHKRDISLPEFALSHVAHKLVFSFLGPVFKGDLPLKTWKSEVTV